MPKIGLEIHGYVSTNEKLFCRCKAIHGLKIAKPNTNICPVCTAQPGSKPMLPNNTAVEKSLQIALMLNCKKIGGHAISIRGNKRDCPSEIRGESTRETGGSLVWQRKHYSWPDLPKGYQNTISGAHAKTTGENGEFLGIKIREVHLEEDPAAWNPKTGEIDYNRSGLPLIEIVTEPDFSSAEQVIDWLRQLILTLSYIKALDKNMGIKADVNISLPELKGKRVEIKNINSLTNIKTAIEKEVERQKNNGVAKVQETRMFDESKGTTLKMREKELAEDYRFISDPDLPIMNIKEARIKKIKSSLPETPQEKLQKLIKKYKIEKRYAEILTKKLEIVEFFEKIIEKVDKKAVKLATRWTTEEMLSVLNYNKKEIEDIDIKPAHFIELLKLIENKKITELKAKDILRSWKQTSTSPKQLAKEQSTISNKNEIEKIVEKVIKENQKAVNDYKNGEQKAMNFLVGRVMKFSNKRADFKTAKDVLEKLMKQ